MIIVKLTILSCLITAFYILAIRIWASSNVFNAISARLKNRYPLWMYPVVLFMFLDVIGIFASAIYLLFFR